MTSYSFSNQTFAQRLAESGVSLDQPWEPILSVTVRVYNVLTKNDILSLREVVEAVDKGEQELLHLTNFGRTSLNDVRESLESLIAQSIADPPTDIKHLSQGMSGTSLEVQDNSLADRLKRQGMSLEQRWEEALPTVSVRVQNALKESHYITLGEVVEALDNAGSELMELKNFGRSSLRELRDTLVRLADEGPDALIYGPEGRPPSTFAELIEQMLEALSGDDRRVLVRRLLDGLTLEQVGQEYRLTRERIRQKLKKVKVFLHKRWGLVARKMTLPVITAAQAAGGMIHKYDVEKLTGEPDLKRVLCGLFVADEDSFRLWREEYLTLLTSEEMQQRLRHLRRRAREARNLDEVQSLAEQVTGFRVIGTTLWRDLILEWGGEISEDGSVIVGMRKAAQKVGRLLQLEARAMHFTEVAELYASKYPQANLSDLLDDSKDANSNIENSRTSLERAMMGALDRHEEIYLIGRGTYIHADAMTITQERLDEIVEWCVRRIEGEAGAISTEFLLKELEKAGLCEDGLNKHLLKDALSRHSEVIRLRKFQVGHVASFREHGLTLYDRIEAVLRASRMPMTLEEVNSSLPRGIEYFSVSISMCLMNAPFSVSVGEGRYCHIDWLDLSATERIELSETAWMLLPEDGSPVACTTLLDQLRGRLPHFAFLSREDAPSLLWGILRREDNVQCGHGYLVARKSDQDVQSLLEDAIVQIVREIKMAFPRDIRREMANRYGYRQSQSYIFTCLRHCVDRGLLRRLPGSLYFLTSIDDETLFVALALRDRAVRIALNDPDLSSYDTEDLWLLARYLYRNEELREANKLLDLLLTRADLSEGQRRSFNRLRAVIWSKLEDN